MFLDIEKWHGCANDFVVTYITRTDGELVLDSLKRQAVAICNRRTGVGADGILVLHVESHEELMPSALTIINSDGSIAQNCGNGIRCAAMSILKRHEKETDNLPEAVEFTVEGQPIVARFLPCKKGQYPLVAVEMGVPTMNDDNDWHDQALGSVRAIASDNNVDVEEISTGTIGNQHIVVKVTPEATIAMARKMGPALQVGGSWDGINVHIVSEQEVTDGDQTSAGNEVGGRVGESYLVKVWERGAGETMACGSGACIVGAAAFASGLVERDEWIAIDMPGGRLYVQHEDESEPVLLAGPATFVFGGKLEV